MFGTRTALFMDVCNPAIAAVQFTAYMSLLNLVISYTAYWQGKMASVWGYPAVLLIDGLAGLLCLAVLPLVKPRHGDRAHDMLPPDGPEPGAAVEPTMPRGR